jgi:hypothetical protein
VCCGMLKLGSQILNSMMFWDSHSHKVEIDYLSQGIDFLKLTAFLPKTCKIHNLSFGCLI